MNATAAGAAPAMACGATDGRAPLPQILHLAELLAGRLTENRSDLLPMLLEDGSRFHHLSHSQLATLVQFASNSASRIGRSAAVGTAQGLRL